MATRTRQRRGSLAKWVAVDPGAFSFGPAVAMGRTLTFREYIDRATNGRFQWFWHAERLADVLQRVADDELSRLMVFMPPRHGKSEEVSRLFPGYYLYRHPERWVGLNSYAADLAYTFSRAAREHFLFTGGQIKDDAGQVKHWETTSGGGLWAAGVGGPITGKGFHLGIIDDPLKNAEEAASETIRAKQRDWYDSTFSTREEPGGAIVVIQTRWHEDDLSGYLLAKESDEEPENWHIVNFEAIKEAEPAEYPPTCTVEPDPRKPDEPLCVERYPVERLRKIKARIGAYFWSSLFQQRPRPKEGGFFKWDWFRVQGAAPAVAERVRYWDTAGTEGGGDWTVGVLMAKTPDGEYVVEDVTRGQWSPNRKDTEIKAAADRDAAKYGRNGVVVWLEQEAGIGGSERSQSTIKMLAGYTVKAERITGSKEARAEPFASQAEAGNVRLVEGDWNRVFLTELCDFPHGKHDDQVDAASGAFNKLALRITNTATSSTFRVI